MSIFCPNCGKELSDNARFCNACGQSITVAAQEPAPFQEPAPQPAPAQSEQRPDPIPKQRPNPNVAVPEQYKPETEKKNKFLA